MLFLQQVSDALLPMENQLVLSEILPFCASLCDISKPLLFPYGSVLESKVTWSTFSLYFCH